MAHQRLPDEVLKEIITPLLEVPNTLFNNVDVVSPFSKVEWPSSSVLLVCTRWLRIATPACYGVAVIRSEAQACAFNAALTRNPEFARHIKRFRIEGTYPRFITPAIIDLLTGVRELCINIGLLATQSPRDIINLVNKLNPKSLVLFNSVDRKGVNSSQRAIIRTIAGRLPSWNRLVRCLFAPFWLRLHDSAICRPTLLQLNRFGSSLKANSPAASQAAVRFATFAWSSAFPF